MNRINTDAIARGVEYLDNTYPDWRDRVDPDTLDMRQEDADVLAQVTGMGYTDAIVAALGMTGGAWSDEIVTWAVEHGFAVRDPDDPAEYDFAVQEEVWAKLTDIWREHVRDVPDEGGA